MEDAGCGQGAAVALCRLLGKGSSCPWGAGEGAGMEVVTPPATLPAPWEERGWGHGAFVASLAGSWSWSSLGENVVPRVPSQLLARSLVPAMAGVTIPCTQGHWGPRRQPSQGVGWGHEVGARASLHRGLGATLAPLPCLKLQKDGIPGLHESPHLPSAPSNGAESAESGLLPGSMAPF